ncbi:periplasmic divalent cation tolerance protein CutA [Vibrio ponticus]|nr:periplasmic divalent cation tolerance protein CutA [Vibrio ponticus]
MNQKYCVVLTTTNNDENKNQLIKAILEKQLAACIQTMPIESHYVWHGELCCDNETLLVIKSKQSCYSELERTIIENHCYETPQVIQLPFSEGFNPYLTWLEENTRR